MINSNIRLHKVAQNNILTLATESASVLESLYNFFGCVGHVTAELAPRAILLVMAPTKSVYTSTKSVPRASYQYKI